MITNLGSYDVGVFFTSNYLCSGSFYDSFEYFCMLRKKFNTCLILVLSESKGEIWKTIKDRYDVDLDELEKDIKIVPKNVHFANEHPKVVKIRTKVLFSPSMSAIAQMYRYSVLIPHHHVVVSQEVPYDNPDVVKAFTGRSYVYNITMLRDDRVFPVFPRYMNRTYRQTINFDIFKTLSYPVDDRCLINVCTDHKCYPVEELVQMMDRHFPKRWLIYTKRKWYDKYKELESDNVSVELAPLDNFMNRFDKMLYLPSLRALDPSPRLLAECFYFGKKVIYYNFGDVKDGGYWRWKDCLEDFDKLKMTENDEIFGIIGEYLDEISNRDENSKWQLYYDYR